MATTVSNRQAEQAIPDRGRGDRRARWNIYRGATGTTWLDSARSLGAALRRAGELGAGSVQWGEAGDRYAVEPAGGAR